VFRQLKVRGVLKTSSGNAGVVIRYILRQKRAKNGSVQCLVLGTRPVCVEENQGVWYRYVLRSSRLLIDTSMSLYAISQSQSQGWDLVTLNQFTNSGIIMCLKTPTLRDNMLIIILFS